MKRRRYLGVLGIVGLSGCSKARKVVGPAARVADNVANELDNQNTKTESKSQTPEQETLEGLDELPEVPITSVDTSETISPYGWKSWTLNTTSRVSDEPDYLWLNYEVIVRDGPEIDVYFLRLDEFKNFEKGHNFVYLTDHSSLSTLYASSEGEIKVDNYALLVDHSDTGPTEPDVSGSQNVEVEIDLTIDLL